MNEASIDKQQFWLDHIDLFNNQIHPVRIFRDAGNREAHTVDRLEYSHLINCDHVRSSVLKLKNQIL